MFSSTGNRSGWRGLHWRAVATLLIAFVPALTACAQQQDGEQRINELRAEIRAIVNEGEVLQSAGRQEQARQRFARAEEMQVELREWIDQLEHERNERAEEAGGQPHFVNVIEHLEHAMMILNEHGNTELSMQIDRVANQIRERIQRMTREGDAEDPEKRTARRQIEVIHSALPALREGDRGDAIELAELAIGAREMRMEGMRGEEARHIYERAPQQEQLRRILGMSIELYQEFGMADRAERLAKSVREVFPVREVERGREQGERSMGDREMLAHQIEVMRIALPALLEAERQDTAELLEHAIRARVLMLEQRRDEEAIHIIETAPPPGAVVEIMGYASRLWAEFGREERAQVTGQMAEQLGRELRSRREGGGDHGDDGRQGEMQRLERQVEELQHAINRLQEELQLMRGRE